MRLYAFQEGNIACALYQVGGSAYEQECLTKLRGLSVDEIGCTSGSYFGCKSVYHIPFLSSKRTPAVSIDDLTKKNYNNKIMIAYYSYTE